jgi:hypothetical protein
LLKHELWGQVWRFDISKNFAERSSGDEITLDFTGIESASQDMEILLIDRDLARLIDLRKTSRYQFYLGEKGFVSNDAEARFMIIAGTGESVKEHESELLQLPEVTRLCQNYPNPFNPTTLIRFDISSAADVELKIYDAPGAFVRELFTGRCAPGRYEVEWDGVSSNGQPVASGIYFCRLRTEQLMQTRKLILLR